MTEQEYIDATNLAKLRTIRAILYDCLPMRPQEEASQKLALAEVRKWIEYLEPIVNPSESSKPCSVCRCDVNPWCPIHGTETVTS